MKNKDISIRGGHTLKYVDGDLWEFVRRNNTPLYLTFGNNKNDKHSIIAMDADGMGMPLMLGCQVCDFKIVSMFESDGKYMVGMKLVMKEKITDLEQGDIIYVTNTSNLYNIIRFEVQSIVFHELNHLKWYDITSKTNKHILVKEKNENDKLDGVDGVEITLDTISEKAFSNEKFAKKYVYDIIQDKINELRNRQKEIML